MPRLAGVLWILLASFFYAGMGACTKLTVPVVGLAPVIFWRSVVVALVAGAAAWMARVPLRPGNLGLLLVRSTTGLVAMALFFYALGAIPLGTATTLLYTSPLFTVLLAALWLGEARRKGSTPLTLLAFVGVGLIVRPGAVVLEWGVVAAMLSGFLAAVSYVAVRKLRQSDPPARIVLYFAIISALGTAPFMIDAPLPTLDMAWLEVLGVGVFAAGGQLAMTQAYRVEQANIVGPFSYVTVVWSYLLGLYVWGESPDAWSILGVALVVGAGAMLSGSASASRPEDEAAPARAQQNQKIK